MTEATELPAITQDKKPSLGQKIRNGLGKITASLNSKETYGSSQPVPPKAIPSPFD